MIEVRRAGDRGAGNLGWLNARHSFSFGQYHDPERMGFGTIRVINEDRIEPGQGFGTHAHKDMEIVTYMIDGALEHKDDVGNGSVIHRGGVQRMSAGTGIRHSEFNHSAEDRAHLLQIWIVPEHLDITPDWEEKTFTLEDKLNRLRLIASHDARAGSMKIHQKIDQYATVLDGEAVISHTLAEGHQGWVQVVNGQIEVNDELLVAGDAAAVEDTTMLHIQALQQSEFLLIDLFPG